MKVIVTSDLHIHPYRLCSNDGGKDRLHDGLSAVRQSLEFSRTHKCPWVFLGDMKVPKLSWPQEALTGILEILEDFDDVPKLMLPGNHDGDASHIGGSGLAPFRKYALVVEKPSIVEWEGPPVAVAPWQAKRDLASLFKDAEKHGIKTLLSHGFLAGTFLGPDEVRLPGKGFTLTDLGIGQVFTLALMGDIHKGQLLVRKPHRPLAWEPWGKRAGNGQPLVLRAPGEWAGEVAYPGSPYQQSWGEREDGQKGVLLIDLKTGSISLLPVTGPRYHRIEFNLNFKNLERLLLDAEAYQGDFIQLLVPDTALSGAAQGVIEKFRTKARPRWFHVVPVKEKKDNKRTEMHTAMANEELLKSYMEARPMDLSVSKEQALAAGLHLLQEETR